MAGKRPRPDPARNRDVSLSERVHQQLRQAICDGRYQPGQRIPESEVSRWLGVSRTPVREAFRRLQSDGLVVSTPWRGVAVAELDHHQVVELFAMRRVLEGSAARLAAQHAAEAEIESLYDLWRGEESEGLDADARAEANNRFHQVLYAAAHNRYLLQALNALGDSLALLRPTTYALPRRPRQAHEEHRRIIDAIKRRDADAAEEAARAHIDQAERLRLGILSDTA